MGLLKGNLTFFKLKYEGNFPSLLTEVIDKLNNFSFDKIYDDLKYINYGFIPFDYPEFESFENAEITFGEYYIFSLRIDEKKVNNNFFLIEFEKAKKQLKHESGKEKLNKSDIEFLKSAVTKKILKDTPPATNLVEVIVDVNNSSIFVSKLNGKILDAITHLFKVAFDLNVYRETLIETIKSKIDDLTIVDDLINSLPTSI
ncbi:hypothetical protein FHQ18_05880 [Deferribacter autotrophicus]|uniref:Recombination-associated protein RdgC n=1 Tax=Deferribacter autotrophicus TaxID=500465 RepID=A0A5A8F3G8_9BACT|nr:hypothetical protein [Deferribacter autotrophicus]KAA0258685.1 hypothetical protein FHQ18_05880 [Deferribacter autotrophicus]